MTKTSTSDWAAQHAVYKQVKPYWAVISLIASILGSHVNVNLNHVSFWLDLPWYKLSAGVKTHLSLGEIPWKSLSAGWICCNYRLEILILTFHPWNVDFIRNLHICILHLPWACLSMLWCSNRVHEPLNNWVCFHYVIQLFLYCSP